MLAFYILFLIFAWLNRFYHQNLTLMKFSKPISWFLGISMFMFGVLKFVPPFRDWYTVQITNSGLGSFSYAMGISGEMTVGAALIMMLLPGPQVSDKIRFFITGISCCIIIVMMLTGIYVHLHPNVPAEVLPLKIKSPFIPAFFIALAVANLFLTRKDYRISAHQA